MAVMVKLLLTNDLAVSTGVLNKLIEKKIGDVWEYPIVKSCPKIRIGSGLCIKIVNANIVQKPKEDEEFFKIMIDDVSAEILRESGFDIDDFGFWYVRKDLVLDIFEDERRVWND